MVNRHSRESGNPVIPGFRVALRLPGMTKLNYTKYILEARIRYWIYEIVYLVPVWMEVQDSLSTFNGCDDLLCDYEWLLGILD